MPDIASNINTLLRGLSQTAQNHGRSADDIQLLAVSKTQTADAVREAYTAGLHAFGENYLQEALDKMQLLQDLAIEWHFIGPIQSNKTRPVAEHFAWAHAVDRLKIAQRLSAQRPPGMTPLNICLQVNIDGEETKAGVAVEDLADLAIDAARLPGIALRGLMAIPRPATEFNLQREPFFRLRQLLDNLRGLAPELSSLDTLSMGMSADLEAAITEGATIVRVGTAIFGPRNYNKH